MRTNSPRILKMPRLRRTSRGARYASGNILLSQSVPSAMQSLPEGPDLRTFGPSGRSDFGSALREVLDARRVAEMGAQSALLGEVRDPRPVAGTPGGAGNVASITTSVRRPNCRKKPSISAWSA
jgi:hypothetical protein